MTGPAPIAVFAYDRAGLLRDSLAALEACPGFAGRRVHVFCDAPARAADEEPCGAVAELAARWCDRTGARLVTRPANLGFRNITEGLTELCEDFGRAVSIEEDHVVAPAFLAFVDAALDRYSGDDRVFQVTAGPPGADLAAAPDTFFLPMPMPAGWATWRRAWRHFDWHLGSAGAALADPARRHAFDLGGAYPAGALLERARAGTFRSYFIRWYLAMFTHGGLALCTRRALVWNAGTASGVHGGDPAQAARMARLTNGTRRREDVARARVDRWVWPREVAVDGATFATVQAFLRDVASRRVSP